MKRGKQWEGSASVRACAAVVAAGLLLLGGAARAPAPSHPEPSPAVGGASWICMAALVGWGISTGLGDSLGGAVWHGLWYGNGC